ESGLPYFKDLELHTIELKKFSENSQEELSEVVAKVKNALDMWVAFLTRHDLLNKDHLPPELDNEELKKALTVLDVMNFDEEEREIYEGHLKWLRVEANTLKKYKTEGFEEGLEKGEAIGIEKGENNNSIKTARKMIKKKMDIETIIEFTELTREKIEELIKEEETPEDE
ncbi:MAG: hypothetical protein B7Y25_08085, partial [Alphaproteobacteria bacterium 16-39-46]